MTDDIMLSAKEVRRALCCDQDGRRLPDTDVDNYPIEIPVREIRKIISRMIREAKLKAELEQEPENNQPTMNYAVTFMYSFDDDTSVYPFETEDKAVDFLRTSFYEEVRICTEENQWDTEYSISEDGKIARIVNYFDHGEDETIMAVGRIYQ